MDYAANPDAEKGNLEAALCAHVQMRFAFKCRRDMVGGTYQEANDVLIDFVIHLMESIRAGKYEHHGQLNRWVGKYPCTGYEDED